MSLASRSLVIAAVVAAIFGKAVWFDFVWDDYLFLVDNESVKSLANIPSFFAQSTAELYRPLRTFLYAVAYSVFGLNPGFYHALGLVFNIVASILVLRILELCGIERRPAFFGAFLFALHPVHIQNIIFVSSVFDIPAVLCFLTAVYYYLRYRIGEDRKGLGLSVLFFAIGLFFGEAVVAFPFVVLMLEVVLTSSPRLSKRDRKLYAIGVGTALVVYLIIRTYVLGRIQRPEAEFELFPLYMTMMPVFLYYMKLTVLPVPLSPIAPMEIFENALNELTLLSLFLLCIILVTAWMARRENRLVTAGVFWFFLALLPNANLVPTGTLMAERYLYIPSVGFCFLFAVFLSDRTRIKNLLAMVFLGCLAALSFVQTSNWKTGETLWRSALAIRPGNSAALQNLGAYYMKRGDAEKVKEIYSKMSSEGIHTERALAELAAFEIDERNYAGAERKLSALIRMDPESEKLNKNLLIARCQQNKSGWRETASAIMDRWPSAHLYEQVGNCYAKWGESKEAIKAFKKSLSLNTANEETVRKIRVLESSP